MRSQGTLSVCISLVVLLILSLGFSGCNREASGDESAGDFADPANARVYTRAQEDLAELRAELEAGTEDMGINCAGMMGFSRGLLEETHEGARTVAEQIKALCELDAPLQDARINVMQARAALAAQDSATLDCSAAEHAMSTVGEQFLAHDDVVAQQQEVLELCEMEIHLVHIENTMAENREQLAADPNQMIMAACASSSVYFGNVHESLTEHARVTEVRSNLATLCGRDFPLAVGGFHLAEAEAYAVANPEAIMNLSCTSARGRLSDLDAQFEADPDVVAIRTRYSAVCGE